MNQFLEVVRASHEIRLAVNLHQHAKLPTGVDIAADQALPRGARGLLRRRSDALLAQPHFGLADIAIGSLEGLLALHHSRAGAVAQIFY